ncbi:MAG TPA: prolipoprotein diacylglyceryl transferase family protein [Candidatus Polarisedimenticolaceae bacterium]|nr:prolipoprotein diacylglyceryl transferase family protein [Candidatus Polarisedimenticolaceae bacterium]
MIPAVPNGLSVHWFGTLVALGIVTGRVLVAHAARVYGPGDPERAIGAYTWCVLGGILGAHLFEVLAYQPHQLRTEGLRVLFQVWKGSASAGGALGGIAGILLYFRSQKRPSVPYLDALALAIVPGWAVTRLGCAVAHDHPGIRSSAWFAVQFPDGPRLDMGLLDAVVLFVLAAVLWLLAQKKRPELALLGVFALGYSVPRFLLDFLRATDLPGSDRRVLALTPAQWVCLGMIPLGIWFLRHGLRGTPHPPRVEASPEAQTGVLPPAP